MAQQPRCRSRFARRECAATLWRRGDGVVALRRSRETRRADETRSARRHGPNLPALTEAPLRNADFVIEAATERMELKKDIFRSLAAQTRHDAVLATNTSALSVSE